MVPSCGLRLGLSLRGAARPCVREILIIPYVSRVETCFTESIGNVKSVSFSIC